jgi:hypothetical protein
MHKKQWLLATLIVIVVAGAFGVGFVAKGKIEKKTEKPTTLGESTEKQDVLITFADEVYDMIKVDYWDKISDQDLSKLYLLAIEKLVGQPQTLSSNDKNGVNKLLADLLKNIDQSKRKELVTTMSDMVLANLKPFGRSRLYSQKEEQTLSNEVNNVNPGTDHFQELGVPKTADDKQVAQAYEEKTKELEPQAKESTAAAQKLAQVKQAYNVLKDSETRKTYELSGVETTIVYKQMTPEIFYVHLTRFSPTSIDDFVRTMAKADKGKLDTLIFDLRDNIGGAIDSLPYFLGPFIGPDQYAYQFFHQGEKEDYKTRTTWLNSLVRYNKVVILINENSQSSAEVMAATLKKYNVGVVVGTTTRGWGTVEKVFPMKTQIDSKEKFSLFMVHRLTLSDSGEAIEGRGVDPLISIKDPNWKTQLLSRFNYPDIVKAVEDIYKGI